MIQLRKKTQLIIILNLFVAIQSFACSCEGKPTVPASVRHADVVFSGHVISKTITTNYDSLGIVMTGDTSKIYPNWREMPIAVVSIKIDKMFKGELVSDTITILTPSNGASCGYYFQAGEKYIVYATIYDEMPMTYKLKRRSFDNKTFWTHQCTRTQYWNIAEENEVIKETK